MKIKYISDIHLEFINPDKIDDFIGQITPQEDEVCILAGDIGNPYSSNYDHFMNYMNRNFRKTFIIAGNHEYYSKTKTPQEIRAFMRQYFTDETRKNITFLDNSTELFEGYLFVGTTLWSKIREPQYAISDLSNIKDVDWEMYNAMNQECVDFLEATLENVDANQRKNVVVITHHLPTYKLIQEKYKTPHFRPYNQWFYCDLDELIESHAGILCAWFYGHTHSGSTDYINGVPFLCNPVGYRGENEDVQFNCLFEVTGQSPV
jgi:predicted MPP superfamily phosphohydrolase